MFASLSQDEKCNFPVGEVNRESWVLVQTANKLSNEFLILKYCMNLKFRTKLKKTMPIYDIHICVESNVQMHACVCVCVNFWFGEQRPLHGKIEYLKCQISLGTLVRYLQHETDFNSAPFPSFMKPISVNFVPVRDLWASRRASAKMGRR